MVRGVVLDPDGGAVPGADVFHGVRRTTSGADGAFKLVLDPAELSQFLVAVKAGHGTGQSRIAGRDEPVSVVLAPAARIEGEVRAPSGPVEGAQVVLADGAWRRTVVTGLDGRFSFPEARTLECVVSATKRGFIQSGRDVSRGIAPRDVKLWLEPSDDVELRCVASDGSPVAGARVIAEWPVRPGVWLSPTVSGTTDATGRAFSIPRTRLPNRISAHARGFAHEWHFVADDPDFDGRITLTRDIRVELAVEGPDAGAWVFALATESTKESGGIAVGGDVPWVSPAPTGRVRLAGARAGEGYVVVADRLNQAGARASPRLVAWRTAELGAGQPLIAWTPPTLTRTLLQVRDQVTGAPARNEISIRPKFDLRERGLEPVASLAQIVMTPDAAGDAEAWLVPGTYAIAVKTPDGERSSSAEVGALAGTIALAVPAGHALRGRLQTSTGIRLPGRLVTARGIDGSWSAVATTDASGAFEFSGIPAGFCDVRYEGVRGEVSVHGPVRLTVPDDAAILRTVECRLRGRATPVPEPLSTVALRPAGRTDLRWIIADLDELGVFEILDLAPGNWDLELRSPTQRPRGEPRTITVSDGAEITIDAQ